MHTDSGTKIVFLDLEDIQDLHGIVQSVCEAVKHPDNPLLPLGDLHEWDSLRAVPWEGTVIYDEEERLFKCWYGATDVATLELCACSSTMGRAGLSQEESRNLLAKIPSML